MISKFWLIQRRQVKNCRKMLFQLLSFLLILRFIPLASGEVDPHGYLCGASNNTFDSIFSTNLDIALNKLQENTAPTGFRTTTSRINSTQPVTAIALCRAKLDPSHCQTCIDAGVLSIRRVCPNKTAAQVWHTYCTVRYSSNNFLNKSDVSYAFGLYHTREVPNPSTYDNIVKNFSENLSYLAGRLYDERYVVAKTKAWSNTSMYGYVECTRESCTKCLLSITTAMRDRQFSGKWTIWVCSPTCCIQVNMDDPVHKDWKTAPDIDSLLVIRTSAPATEMEPELPPKKKKNASGGSSKVMIIGLAAGLGLVGVISNIIGLLWILKRRRGRAKAEEVIKKVGIEIRPFLFDLDVLIVATDNFSQENMIGRGGFGTVYKGRMADGKEIAVKKLAADSSQGKEEFANEVRVLSQMQHRNLVQLLGCCVQGNQKILVYEYLSNKSLEKFLFGKSKCALDWEKRFNIILGVARGLLYLHQDSALRIIHRDIKASNILLDDKMNPKISDFGFTKLFDEEQIPYKTCQIAGTLGYMAPEYVIQGLLSAKSDVFSFGVLMLEVVSGRKNFDRQLDEEEQELLKLAGQLEKEDRLMELVDKAIGSFPEETTIRVMRIALLCTQESTQDRPTMSSTLSMLTNSSVIIPPPGKPACQSAEGIRHGPCRDDLISGQSITVSLLNGR